MATGITRLAAISTVVLLAALLLPEAASGQQASGIAGAVRDASGAVLPGVTVEATSPALIEKVRIAITDGEGRYSIVDLRPGTYAVTFTLPGFCQRTPRRHRPAGRVHRDGAQRLRDEPL